MPRFSVAETKLIQRAALKRNRSRDFNFILIRGVQHAAQGIALGGIYEHPRGTRPGNRLVRSGIIFFVVVSFAVFLILERGGKPCFAEVHARLSGVVVPYRHVADTRAEEVV